MKKDSGAEFAMLQDNEINVPVNCLKLTRKTYTQAEELVYYFGWKEIPKDTAQAREDQV